MQGFLLFRVMIKLKLEKKNYFDVVIVGGGISGCLAANLLNKAGLSVIILEKSTGIGGRFSTKPVADGIADYGCQYLNPKTRQLKSLIDDLKQKSLINITKFNDGKLVYTSSFGMKAIPSYLSKHIIVNTNQRVDDIEIVNNIWKVETASIKIKSRFLILTMPPFQVKELLNRSNIKTEFTSSGKDYKSFFTATFQSKIHSNSDLICSNSSFPWICNNTMKGLRNSTNIFTVNTSEELTDQIKCKSMDERGKIIKNRLMNSFFEDVSHISVHFWKYAFTENQNHDNFYFDRKISIGICGDNFSVGKVDGAVKSASLLAKKIIKINNS